MARALVITHTEAETPGTLQEWLPAAGVDLIVCRPWAGEPLPADLTGFDALVVMGGPQQAYDDTSAPWLAATKALLGRAVREDLPVLGICLGAQLLAEATGGRVVPGAEGPEVGARLVAKRDAAGDDPIFGELPLAPVVVQWHWDAIVDLPPGALLLASSPRYAHQAFRVGARAYGLQFHIETPPDMVRAWAVADTEPLREAGLDPDVIVERTVVELDEVAAVWRPFVERFAAAVRGESRTYLPMA